MAGHGEFCFFSLFPKYHYATIFIGQLLAHIFLYLIALYTAKMVPVTKGISCQWIIFKAPINEWHIKLWWFNYKVSANPANSYPFNALAYTDVFTEAGFMKNNCLSC